MDKAPNDEQACYDLGWHNPSALARNFQWMHLTLVNAFTCGQTDRQNQAPRNQQYSREQYDPDTFERINHAVTFDPEE